MSTRIFPLTSFTRGVFATLVISNIIGGSLPVDGARILAMMPVFARSHHSFSQAVLKALARAGHEVVVYSPFPLDQPLTNYTDVVMEYLENENLKVTQKYLELTDYPPRKCFELFNDVSDIIFDFFLNKKSIKELFESKDKYDLVVTSSLAAQEFTVVLGHVFNAPVIAVQPFNTNSVANRIAGNGMPLSYIPEICSPFSNRMTFLERFLNSFYVIGNLYYVYDYRYMTRLMKRFTTHFPNAPPLVDMLNNISLIFINDHLTADYAFPRPPNIVPLGGIHIEEEKPLPAEIATFMDGARDGVILFSLGSNVPDHLNDQTYFDMYIRVFRRLPQRVLWKTNKENILGLPDNIKILKWAPQRDILAHPKMVLFITHGGLLSQHETVYCGVPVVVIPQFFDQPRNAKFYEEKGVGVKVNNEDLSETTITAAIREVLDNPKYRRNMKRLSQVFRDRPMTPAETVVYWTEYVLRHGGSHLKPASANLAWYQLILLDVLAVLISLIALIYITIRSICKFLFSNKDHAHFKEKIN